MTEYLALYELGDTPFRLMEAPLKRATAQQLYRIEKCNPVRHHNRTDQKVIDNKDINVSHVS